MKVSEIRHLNAATSIAFGIANSAMSAKQQHIAPLFKTYQQELERHSTWQQKVETGQIQGNKPFDLELDLQTIPRVLAPIKPLQDLVFGQIPTSPLIVNLTVSLTEFLEHLEIAMASRDRQIADFRSKQLPPGASISHLYLGLRYGEGHRNNEFGSTLAAMHLYNEHVIFYSSELVLELAKIAKASQSKFRAHFSEPPPKVSEVDLTGAKDAGLLPARERYEGWLKAFSGTKAPAAWWQR